MKCSIKTTEGRQRVEDREEKKKREREQGQILGCTPQACKTLFAQLQN